MLVCAGLKPAARVRVGGDSPGGALRVGLLHEFSKSDQGSGQLLKKTKDKAPMTNGDTSRRLVDVTSHQQSGGFATGRDRSASGRVVPLSQVNTVGWGDLRAGRIGPYRCKCTHTTVTCQYVHMTIFFHVS